MPSLSSLPHPSPTSRRLSLLEAIPSAGTTINLYIALNPRHENALIDALYEVSDPKHPRHVHPTAAPLTPSFTCAAPPFQIWPHPHTLELVTSWLAHHGMRPSSISTTHGSAWLTVSNVLVSWANEMLGASYQLYRHTKVNDMIIRTVSYALPDVLHSHIQAVAPMTYFASARMLRQTSRRRSVGAGAALAEVEVTSGKHVTVLLSRTDEVMPSQLRWIYKTFAYVSTVADRNTLRIFGFHKQYPSETDLTVFMTYFHTNVQPPSLATFTVEQVNGGGYDPDKPGDEANLDVQYALAMAYPTPIIFYSIGGLGKWVTKSGEPFSGDWWLESLDYLLKKMDIPQTISISYGAYERGTTDYDPEVVAPLSGGRFLDHFPRPAYQDITVSAFLECQGTQYAGLYNPEGRGIPDIAAQALMLPIVVRNNGISVDGTSCSVPIVAGIISLLNDYLITGRRPPLGFLNIWLYQDGFVGLNDIISGSNPGCGTDGFSAVPGWDPVHAARPVRLLRVAPCHDTTGG
ncbi:subtilisin-like protein [Lactarius deliciosus]|nr:subtilisin-like protein [Lactarius deliciosus]